MNAYAQAPSSLLMDDRVRMYFSCRAAPDAAERFVSRTAWVDLDRGDPTRVLRVADRPVLELGGVGSFDEFGVYPFSAIRDGAFVRAYYGGWTRCESVPFDVAIGAALSRDGGKTYEKIGPGPVLGRSQDEPFVISGPKIRRFGGRWRLFYIAGRKWKIVDGRPEPVYRIRMASSEDGLRWERLGRDLIAPRIEEDEAQASPDVTFSSGRYHMFFCYRRSRDFRAGPGGYRIGYASSTDMENWARDDARAGLEPSASGWDGDMTSYPHVFEIDGRVFMAYLGDAFGRDGFGLARLEGELA